MAHSVKTRLLQFAALGALTAGCNAPDCYTDSGMAVYGSTDCTVISQVEETSIKAFAGVWQGREDTIRALFSLWVLEIGSGPTVPNPLGDGDQQAFGLTHTNVKTIQIGNGPRTYSDYLPHEIAHALEYEITGREDRLHKGWLTNGIWDAIYLTGRVLVTTKE